jgi:hypothetical protein
MRYCSARWIQPASVDEAVLDAYMRYRAETTSLASSDAFVMRGRWSPAAARADEAAHDAAVTRELQGS